MSVTLIEIMRKEELVRLHELMSELREYFKQKGGKFEEYEQLRIDPSDLHKSKEEHKHAVFILGKELAGSMAQNELSDRSKIKERMEELAKETKT